MLIREIRGYKSSLRILWLLWPIFFCNPSLRKIFLSRVTAARFVHPTLHQVQRMRAIVSAKLDVASQIAHFERFRYLCGKNGENSDEKHE
jgi:hypothetical protein